MIGEGPLYINTKMLIMCSQGCFLEGGGIMVVTDVGAIDPILPAHWVSTDGPDGVSVHVYVCALPTHFQYGNYGCHSYNDFFSSFWGFIL